MSKIKSNMVENHIDEILIDLYATRHRFLPKSSSRAIAKHLRQCDICIERFMDRCVMAFEKEMPEEEQDDLCVS
jgi:hypothetical protein